MNFFRSLKRDSLVWNSGLIAVVQGMSGLLNLCTQILLARQIGMGGVSDGFFVAYVVPDTVAGIFLSLALLVLLPRVVDGHGLTVGGKALCWTFAGVAGVILLGLSVAVLLLSRQVVGVLGPGLSEKGAEVAAGTLHIMAFVMFFQGVSGVAVATLQAAGRFGAAAGGRVIFSLGPFLAALLWFEKFGVSGVAWAALGGAALAFVYLMVVMVSVIGLPKWGALVGSWPEALEVARGLLPVLVARALAEGWGFVLRAVATGTLAGGATLLVLSQRFGNILMLIGNSFGTVAYPELARKAKGATEEFVALVRLRSEQSLVFLSVLAWPMAGIADDLLLMTTKGEQALAGGALLQPGSVALALFCLMAPWVSVNSIVGNIMWACGRVWSRLGVEAVTYVLLIPLLWLGARWAGVVGIPVVMFLGWILLLFLGEWMLRGYLGSAVFSWVTVRRWLWITCLSLVGGVVSALVGVGLHQLGEVRHVLVQLVVAGVAYALGAGVAAGLVYRLAGAQWRKGAVV